MSWNGRATADGAITERAFELTVESERVPGVYWAPVDRAADRLVLLGHGGTTHKKVDYLVDLARRLAGRGIAALAIDGPGHGERATGPIEGGMAGFAGVWRDSGGTDRTLADWRAAIDFIEKEAGGRPTGWWGLSMGTMMGLPVVATDHRIRLAVLGLMGNHGPNADDLMRLAPEVTVPVLFLMQWNDELIPRQACLALFEAIGAAKKTLHANPGTHSAVPQFEIAASVDYLDRHLR